MINRQQTAQRALTGDGVVKNTQSYLRCKICASVRHLPKMDKSVVQYLTLFFSSNISPRKPKVLQKRRKQLEGSRACVRLPLLPRVKFMMQTVSNRTLPVEVEKFLQVHIHS